MDEKVISKPTKDLRLHPIHQKIPDMMPDEWASFLADVKLRGIVVPLEVKGDVILDGRHRYKASIECNISDIPVVEKEIADDEILEYVVKAATLRRHLTTSQRAMLAVELEPMFAEEAGKRKLAQLKRGAVSPVSTDLDARETPDQTRSEKRSDTKAGNLFGVGHTTVSKAKRVAKVKPPKVKDIIAGKTTVDAVYKKINQAEREKKAKEKLQANEKAQAKIILGDSIQLLDKIPDQSYDCLLTDPLYITDVENFETFAKSWIHKAFSKIKLSGHAFIFCSSDPQEISIYYRELSQIPNFTIGNLLVWTYENTIGPMPKYNFKNNWQGIFYLYGKNAKPLDSPLNKELFSVFKYPAPDGRNQTKYHRYQKPVELIQHLLKVSTQECDSVLDLFAGSGSIGIASANMGRQSLSIERDKKSFEIAIRRGGVSFEL